MTKNVISEEHLTKKYDLGVIGTGTLIRDVPGHGLMDNFHGKAISDEWHLS